MLKIPQKILHLKNGPTVFCSTQKNLTYKFYCNNTCLCFGLVLIDSHKRFLFRKIWCSVRSSSNPNTTFRLWGKSISLRKHFAGTIARRRTSHCPNKDVDSSHEENAARRDLPSFLLPTPHFNLIRSISITRTRESALSSVSIQTHEHNRTINYAP